MAGRLRTRSPWWARRTGHRGPADGLPRPERAGRHADVPVLVPGANSFTFNAGFAAPSSRSRARCCAPVVRRWPRRRGSICAQSTVGARVHASQCPAWAIAANGAYSLARTLPQGGGRLGGDGRDPATGVPTGRAAVCSAVVNGRATLTFDVLHQPVQLQLSGTMTKAPARRWPGPCRSACRAIDSAYQLAYLERAVMRRAGAGRTPSRSPLPVHTDHVDLVGYVGTRPFEQSGSPSPASPAT